MSYSRVGVVFPPTLSIHHLATHVEVAHAHLSSFTITVTSLYITVDRYKKTIKALYCITAWWYRAIHIENVRTIKKERSQKTDIKEPFAALIV